MFAQKKTVSVTTDGSGAATAYSEALTGRILAIHYRKTDFADGVDFAITLENTGEGLWTEANVNAAAIRYPRAGVHGVDGVAATLNGTQLVRDAVVAVQDRVKIIIASGGDTKAGAFDIIVG